MPSVRHLTRPFLSVFLALTSISAISTCAYGQTAPPYASEVDDIANKALAASGVPSASVAIVKDGKLTYVHAYGKARIDPPQAAQPAMRYSIGSISKQFTAAAILLLAEDGKLSLNDHVSKFVPGLTRGDEVTIRQILSHTSGYQDYWPQDYVPPFMLNQVNAQKILDIWAHKQLDFDPGTKWQYSNTNFVIAGLIVEKAGKMPFLDFLMQRIFKPLGMTSVLNIDQSKLTESDPTGYFRFALGPPRVAPKEGKGWLFAAGELAMTAEDLEKWNISILKQSLLKPESYRELETEILLKNGSSTGYALGIAVGKANGHRVLRHGGEVSGFTSTSAILPDDGMAVVVLTNQDAIDASGQIARGIVMRLLQLSQPADAKEDVTVKALMEGLAAGKLDHSLFSDNGNAYFSETALADYKASLSPLGALQGVQQTATGSRGGMTFRNYTAHYSSKTLNISIYELSDGKIEQFIVTSQD
jgi:D-alanyl-D-alanine carboxypeptidase